MLMKWRDAENSFTAITKRIKKMHKACNNYGISFVTLVLIAYKLVSI